MSPEEIAERITAGWWDAPAIETRAECVEALTQLVRQTLDARSGGSQRVAFIGSRPDEKTFDGKAETLRRHAAVRLAVLALHPGTVVVTGAWWDGEVLRATQGVDRVAAITARDAGLTVCLVAGSPVHGKAAGVIRNPVVVDIAHGVQAFWDGHSPGTRRTRLLAERAGKLLA